MTWSNSVRRGGVERRRQVHRDGRVIEDRRHDLGVAVSGHGLVRVVEVAVVVVEPDREPFEDRRGQLGGVEAPLFTGVALEERLVEFASDELEGLFLEVRGLVDGVVGAFGDEGLGLVGTERRLEEGVDGHQVDRQRIDPPADGRLDLVVERDHVAVGVDVVPHPFVVGVEDVWAVPVDEDAAGGLVALGVAVAGDVVAAVVDDDVVTGLGELSADHCAGEPGSCDADPHGAIDFGTPWGDRVGPMPRRSAGEGAMECAVTVEPGSGSA